METIEAIVAERRTYSAAQNTHAHMYAQVIFPLQGELSIKTDTQTLQLDDQTLFYIPPKCHHTFHSAVRNEFLVLDIPYFMLSTKELQNRSISIELTNQWKGIRHLLLNETGQNPALKELYPYISYHLLQDQQPKSIQYIHNHYDKPISISQLASLEHYNRTYFSEWFMKETGKSPASYIRDVRLNKAKELLRHTNLPILHIAIQVGLEHQSSLTRLFQKYEGITPSQYRKNTEFQQKYT
ncbi:AraC family transcriptional regulator [Bacillus sp. FJAT-52991]|uniref:AraC family transcriptional regulator n=1 Tax=Bacillus kandeliae TaxID=3129297 RepID=A0ABZ2N424_9BACI